MNNNRIKLQCAWTDDTSLLSSHIIDYFSSLFCRSSEVEGTGPDLSSIDSSLKIRNPQAVSLVSEASCEEVKKAIFGMKKYGSPGPNGIPAVFY